MTNKQKSWLREAMRNIMLAKGCMLRFDFRGANEHISDAYSILEKLATDLNVVE